VPAARLEARDLSLGIPPVRATYITQFPDLGRLASEIDWSIGAPSNNTLSAAFMYELPYYMKADYYDLQSKTAKYFTYQNPVLTERRRKILETTFPVVTQGNYQVDIAYTLPGIDKVTTRRSYTIYNPFK